MMTNFSHGDLEADAKDYAIYVLIDTLRASASGLCTENAFDYMAKGVSAGHCLQAADALATTRAELAAMREARNRTLSDHGRMLWREDRKGHCLTPDLCDEYEMVRCSPCAIKQSRAAGVEPVDPERTYSPEACRLNRELAVAHATIHQLGENAAKAAGEYVAEAAARFCSELQEDADGVPQQELSALHEALNRWEGLGPRVGGPYDDSNLHSSVLADLSMLERDPHATDTQRRIAARAIVALSALVAKGDSDE